MNDVYNICWLILLILSISFTSCKKDKPALPEITTNEVTVISTNSAVSGGDIANYEVAEVISKEISWNTLGNPVIDDNRTTETGGSGSYTSNILQLTPNTTYFVRAYATNSTGTGYGNQQTFQTDPASITDIDGNTYNVVRM